MIQTMTGAVSFQQWLSKMQHNDLKNQGTKKALALKDSSGLTVVPAFSDHVQVIISDSEATLTLLHVNRSDDGDYQYFIRNTNFRSTTSTVNVFVQCKQTTTQQLNYSVFLYVFVPFICILPPLSFPVAKIFSGGKLIRNRNMEFRMVVGVKAR